MSTSKAIRSSYFWFFFVPIVAKALSRIDTVEFSVLGKNISIDIGLPFTWEYFFYSAVFMALATLVFMVFCPDFIKAYGSCTEYIDKGHTGHQTIKVFLGFVHEATKKGQNKEDIRLNVSDFLSKYCENGAATGAKVRKSDVSPIQALSNSKVDANQECGAFYHVQDFIDRDMAVFRVVSSWGYWLGFLLIGYVCFENVWFVLENHLFTK
ncbi:MAG: hypothetical protein WB783_08720 [Arenicellales bacterium]